MTKCNISNCVSPFSQNDKMQLCKKNKPLPKNTTETNTEINITENNNQSTISQEMIDEREDCLRKLRINTDYYKILLDDKFKANKYDEILNLLSDVLIQNTGEILINKTPVKMKYVKERFLSLNSLHMDYIIKCLDSNVNKINNIRSYILTTVFNAPVTMNAYYINQTKYDLNNEGIL